MSDEDTTQPISTEPVATPEQPEVKQDLSLAEELAQANDKTTDDDAEQPQEPEVPETPEQPEEPAKPEAKEEPEADEDLERRRRNYEQMQQRLQEKQRKEAEQQFNRAYQPQPVDELTKKYIDEGYDEFQAKMLANEERRDQQAQINQARTEVAELNMQIETESVQIMHEFPIFDPNSEEYKQDKGQFAKKAAELYHRAAGVQTDKKTGLVISAAVIPYDFYKDLAELRNAGLSQAQIKAQKAAEAQLAAAAPPMSSTARVNKSDEDAQADRLRAAFAK